MTKSIITILFVGIIISSQAQLGGVIKSMDEVEIGGGPSLLTLRGVQANGYGEIKIGYSVGVSATWYLKKRMAIVAKLFLERKGMNTRSETLYYDDQSNPQHGESEEKINFNYFTLPVNIRYYFGNARLLFFEAGPYLSYMYKGQSITKYSWRGTEISDLSDGYKDIDAGLSLAVGYKVLLRKKKSLNFWINEGLGLIDVSLQPSNSIFHTATTQSLTLGVSLSNRINVDK